MAVMPGGKKIELEDAIAIGAGAVAGLIGAGVLTGVKWLVEWGRPSVMLATGAVDTTLGGLLVYNRFFKKERTGDPFYDTASATFGVLDLLVGVAAILGGVGRLTGNEFLQVDKLVKSVAINSMIKASEIAEAVLSAPQSVLKFVKP
jgi:hypothetical protein